LVNVTRAIFTNHQTKNENNRSNLLKKNSMFVRKDNARRGLLDQENMEEHIPQWQESKTRRPG